MSKLTHGVGWNFARLGVLVAAGGGFSLYYLPNTYLTSRYKKVTELYRKADPVPLSEKVNSLVQDVFKDLQISELEKSRISVYCGYGFDVFRIGMTSHEKGGVIGIPEVYKYSSLESYQPGGAVINNAPVPWESSDGKSLKKSLILSDDAKKFIIARECSRLQTYEPYCKGTNAGLILSGLYVYLRKSRSWRLYSHSRYLRMFLDLLVSLTLGVIIISINDIISCAYDKRCDFKAASVSVNYAKGGIEYYEKILHRNVTLRKLLHEVGPKYYTTYGNDEVFLRSPNIPFTVRREYLLRYFESHYKNNNL